MTYQQAITSAKNGNHVKRHDWVNEYITSDSDGNVVHVIVRTITSPYISTNSDIMSDDWQTT